MMGTICLAWLLFWQAGIAQTKLEGILKDGGIDATDKKALRAFLREHKDGAFYQGKVLSARYYIKNVLPEAFAISKAIKNEDLSALEILEESFRSNRVKETSVLPLDFGGSVTRKGGAITPRLCVGARTRLYINLLHNILLCNTDISCDVYTI